MEPLLKNVFEEFHCRKFYDHCDIQRDFELAKSIKNDGKKKRYFFRPDGRLNTIDKETYLENYGNKLWNIHHNRITLVLEDNEDKVSIKAYFYVKYRTEGKHYFVINKRVEFLTFNKKSKIVYVGIKYNKGKQSYVRSNAWNGMINDFFSRLSALCKTHFPNDGEGMFINYSNVFFNKVFGYEKNISENGKFNPTNLLITNYLTLHNVVVPNNYLAFFNNGETMTMKELRKSHLNLIGAAEKKYGLSGKKFHRILHLVNSINSNLINFVQNIVSPKYLKSRPDDEILGLFQYRDYFDVRNYTRLLNKHITDKERINVYTCLVNAVMNGGSVYTFMDHIKFYLTLKLRYNEDVIWRSKTNTEFTVEHIEYSNKIALHRDGEWNRIYSQQFFDIRNYTRLLNKHITEKERINVYTCLVNAVMNGGSVYTFMDHIKFYLTLKLRYNEDVVWGSKTNTEFTVEHIEFSNKIALHKDGEWDRIYSQQFFDGIGKEIATPQGGVYYPILFTKQYEYFDESEHQSNCVKTYHKNTDCFIISLREGSSESKERATIEYRWNYTNSKFERKQSLGRFNKALDSKWDFALEELDNQVMLAVKHFKFEEFKMTKTTQTETIKYNVVKNSMGGYRILQDGLIPTSCKYEVTNEEYLQNIIMFDLDL